MRKPELPDFYLQGRYLLMRLPVSFESKDLAAVENIMQETLGMMFTMGMQEARERILAEKEQS